MSICFYCGSQAEYVGFSTVEGCSNTLCISNESKTPLAAFGSRSMVLYDSNCEEYTQTLQHYETARAKWKDSGLLENLSSLQEMKLARILENQKAYSIMAKMSDGTDFLDMERIIPSIIATAYKLHFKDNIVDIQPMPFPASLIFHIELINSAGKVDFQMKHDSVAASTSRLKLRPVLDLTPDVTHVDYESEVIAKLGQELYFEQRNEITSDLINQSEKHTCSETELRETIDTLLMSSIDGIKYDFIVVPPELVEAVRHLSVRIVINEFAPRNVALLGYRGQEDDMGMGYVFCPFVSFILTPTVYNPETFHVDKRLMTRYAKRMFDKRLYTAIVVKNPKI